MAKLGNIVQLNKKNDDKNVYGTILTYLTRKGHDSLNTRKTYERHIKDFFKTMRNKELEEIIEEDLIFTPQQIEAYQVSLKEKYKGTTVNNALTAIKECYEKLARNGFNVNLTAFDVERYDESDKKSYDTLSYEEVVKIIDIVGKTRKGKEKQLLIRLAYATAFRKESLLNLTWDDIVEIDGVWYIKTIGKGNKLSHKKLSQDLYETLMKYKRETGKDKIFELTNKTVNKMMNHIRKNMNFTESRHIVFHSFKKASVNEVNILSGGDIKLLQSHADHSNAQTTLNDYLAKKSLEDLIIVDINTHVPVEKFDEMTKDELVLLIKSMDRNTQIKLLKKMGEF